MDPFLREQLSKLLWSYSYKTIDSGLRELVQELKHCFDQDYAAISETNKITDKVIKVSVSSASSVVTSVPESVSEVVPEETKNMTISAEPKKRVLKKPAKSKINSVKASN